MVCLEVIQNFSLRRQPLAGKTVMDFISVPFFLLSNSSIAQFRVYAFERASNPPSAPPHKNPNFHFEFMEPDWQDG
jgi:hypothetical protein